MAFSCKQQPIHSGFSTPPLSSNHMPDETPPEAGAPPPIQPSSIILEEWRGSSPSKLSITATITANSTSLSLHRFGSRWAEARRKIAEAFVPEGFPSSVTPDYTPFQIWDSLQGLSTYIRSMLSTQALLSAIGVGEKSATVIGATFQWFLRDFTGMLGGILFTFSQGSKLDSDAKMWRLVADFMNDLATWEPPGVDASLQNLQAATAGGGTTATAAVPVAAVFNPTVLVACKVISNFENKRGMLMDLISPLFPSALIFIVCLGSLSRSFTGVASGATRAALTQHFSLENNAADISAKEGSQETVATMLGMALGMLLAHMVGGNPLAIWVCFLSLTAFHMYANYRAVRCLSLTTLNIERSSILVQHFMKTGKVLTPQQVSAMEHILPAWTIFWTSRSAKLLHQHVYLGIKATTLKHSDVMELLGLAGSRYRKSKYLLLECKGTIMVIIHKESMPTDILRSFFHALVFASLAVKSKFAHAESDIWINEHYGSFIIKLQSSGWRTERLLSPPVIWRAKWDGAFMDEKIN